MVVSGSDRDCRSDFTRCEEGLSSATKELAKLKWDAGRYPAKPAVPSCPRTGTTYTYEVDEPGAHFTLSCHGHPEFQPVLHQVGLPPSKDGILWDSHTDYLYKPGPFRL